MHLVAAADWQDVIIASLTLAGVIFNGFIAIYLTRQVRTPSGETLGKVAERTHDNTAALTMAVVKNGGKLHIPEGDNTEGTA